MTKCSNLRVWALKGYTVHPATHRHHHYHVQEGEAASRLIVSTSAESLPFWAQCTFPLGLGKSPLVGDVRLS